jgi:LysR family transcriptional regulator, regulator for bpeEF and oprC
MELSHLDTFVKVVQTGSFTRAAEQLHSQKAHVSRVVSQLEAGLGVRLLERTTRSLSLTEVGREFFERAVGILGAAEDARRAVQQAQGEPRGTLRLTCGVEFGLLAVNSWVRDYLRRHPGVNVDLEMTGRVVDIVHEGFDLAVRVGPLADSTLAARKLGDLHYGLFAAPGYLRRQPAPTQPQHLVQHALIRFSGSRLRMAWTLTRGDDTHRIEPAARLNANNSFAVRDAALDGLGIAQLPLLLAQPEVEAGRLSPVMADWALPTAPVHAVFASARYLTPKVRAFIDLAAAAFGGPISAPPNARTG